MSPVYRDYDQATLDRECNPASTIDDPEACLGRYAQLSEAARTRHPDRFSATYGRGARNTLDVFPAATPHAPIQLFIHGGGWRMLSKDESSFVADGLVRHGATVVAISYTLLPEATLDQIAEDVFDATDWVWRNAAGFGADRDRIFISGHSAGAHLAGMLLTAAWRQARGLPADLIKGATLVSGNYDLEPLQLSSRNRAMNLDAEGARRNSPLHHLAAPAPQAIVAWGALENRQYRTQASEFAEALRTCGSACEEIEVPGKHHLDVVLELGNADGMLTRKVLAQMAIIDATARSD